MKRNVLITIFALITITLFGQDIKEKGESQAYKHDQNTIFAVMDGSKFHAFKNGDKITHLGYVTFYGLFTTVTPTSALSEENSKHMSESYYFVLEDGVYSLYYKDYIGTIKFLIGTDELKGAEPTVAQGTEKVTLDDLATKITPDPDDEPKEDDDSGGLPWWLIIIGIWFLLGLFKD